MIFVLSICLLANTFIGVDAMAATSKTLVINGGQEISYTGPYGNIQIDGNLITNMPMPALMLDDGRYVVPVREVFEAAGATVNWNSSNSSIVITYADKTISLRIGSKNAYINSGQYSLDAMPRMVAYKGDVSAKVMVPVRFIMEAMNKDVSYDASTQTVIVKAASSAGTVAATSSYKATTYYHNSTLTAAFVEFNNAVSSYKVQELTNPYRLVIDIAGSTCGGDKKTIGDGTVTEVRIGQMDGNVTRIVVESPNKLYYKVAKVKKNKMIGIRLSQSKIPDESGVVMIDPGHGGSDSGATTTSNGVSYRESNFTLAISKKIYTFLKTNGVPVYLTRDSDATLALYDRPEFGNLFGAELFLCVHCNMFTKASANGTETLCYNTKVTSSKIDSKVYAQSMQDAMVKALGTTNRGLTDGSKMVVINSTTMPSVLVETAFLSNSSDLAKLKDPTTQGKLAGALADAILGVLQKYNIIISQG